MPKSVIPAEGKEINSVFSPRDDRWRGSQQPAARFPAAPIGAIRGLMPDRVIAALRKNVYAVWAPAHGARRRREQSAAGLPITPLRSGVENWKDVVCRNA